MILEQLYGEKMKKREIIIAQQKEIESLKDQLAMLEARILVLEAKQVQIIPYTPYVPYEPYVPSPNVPWYPNYPYYYKTWYSDGTDAQDITTTRTYL